MLTGLHIEVLYLPAKFPLDFLHYLKNEVWTNEAPMKPVRI